MMMITVLLQKIVAWGLANPNVAAIISTGSSARGAEATDEYSDLDIEIIAYNPAPLATDDAWLSEFGPIWVSQYFDEGQPNPTRLIYFEGATKVDFTIAGVDRISAMAVAGALDDLYQRGYQVHIDKDRITDGLPPATGAPPETRLPTENEFAETVNEFWFEAAHLPKYLARGDLWVVKFRDWTMKQMLLKMIEWNAVAQRGRDLDTWHIGTKMKGWAGEKTWLELQGVFGHFDAEDAWASLIATTELFRRLTHDTATQYGLAYPTEPEAQISTYIQDEFEKQQAARP